MTIEDNLGAQTLTDKRSNWKKRALETLVFYVAIANISIGMVSYGWRSQGKTEQEIRDIMKHTILDESTKEFRPLAFDPVYWMTFPGRELGLIIYDKWPTTEDTLNNP